METPKPEEALDFLNNYGQKKRPQLGIPKGKNLGVAIGFAALIIILLWAISSLMFGGKSVKNDLVSINAQQQDLIRWTTLATKNARATDVLNNSLIMNQFLTTDSRQLRTYLITYLKDKGVDKETKLLTDKKTDTALEAAASNNRFDDDYRALIKIKIGKYESALSAARKKSSGTNLNAILDQASKNIKTITF